MQIHRDINNLPGFTNAVITIGTFDGVHLGHRQITDSLKAAAASAGGESVIITFHPHPAVLLRSLPMPFYLSTPSEKESIFHQLGADFVLDLEFSRSMANMEPDEFMDLLLNQYQIIQLWLGSDFTLGKNRAGNLTVLSEIGKQKGYSIIECPFLNNDQGKVSSSQIREWVISGLFPPTTRALNRYYSLTGKVTYGDARGKKIGFPTANLDIWSGKLIPKPGVYATWITIENQIFPSVTNVGLRPTSESKQTIPRIEAHILDFEQDIYQKEVQLHFVENIRIEKKFSSIAELTNQIQKDAIQAQEILKNVPKPTGLFTRSP